ncbi:hypothetical protein [Endozoicomonas sp. Mp262]|uniref:hypothetical protein n=1 Tax=Endozoicomonas sp. Mp262 TaxID=2919499 RepID=UPI0021DAE384
MIGFIIFAALLSIPTIIDVHHAGIADLEHNYGHGKQHLASNLACLTFTAFLINQIEQLSCKLFQEALKIKKSKKAFWHAIRGLFDWFCIDNWTDVFTAIIEGRSVSLKLLTVDTT